MALPSSWLYNRCCFWGTWMVYFLIELWRKMNPKRSVQWFDHDEATKHFPYSKLLEQKIMVTVWWSAIGVVHYSFLESKKSITAKVYGHEMHVQLIKMRLPLVNRQGPILFYDNAQSHVARVTLQKLTDLGYETLPHHPYSPDLSNIDYHFFKHLDTFLLQKTFHSKFQIS